MKNIKMVIARHFYGLVAVLIVAATAAPVLVQPSATAIGNVTVRSVQMSTSAASAASQYKITFTPVTTTQEMVVEFCSDSPFEGGACSFSAATVPTVAASPTSSTGTISQLSGGAPAHAFKIVGLTMTGGSAFNLTVLTGLTNPSTVNATFYARIYTYTTGGAASYTETSTSGTAPTIGSPTDEGGIALSTASTIAITAQVLESVSFCVYLGTASCGTAPTFFLGHSANNILDTTAVDTKTVKFDLSTNAVGGAVINIAGDTLKSGSNSIAAAGSSAITINPGDGKFGLYISATSATTGTFTKATNYNGGSGTQYGFNTANTTSTFGDQIANTTSAPMNAGVATITYGATAASTTPAGIYTATHQLIATGTF